MALQKTPFLYLATLSGFSLLALDLYQPALPTITTFFKTTHNLGQLTMSMYLFVFGLAQLVWGPLLDHFGRKKCLPVGLILFLIGTILCIKAPSIGWLILGRAIQGFSVCSANVLAYSSTRDYEEPMAQARAISHISMVVSISPIFAPLLGSVVFLYFGWQATFILMALIALVLLGLSYIILRESPNWQAPTTAFEPRRLFAHYEGFFSHRPLTISTTIITAAYASAMIFVVNAAYLIIVLLHFHPAGFAVLFATNGMMIILGNFIGIRLRQRFSTHDTMWFGCIINIIGSLLMLGLHLIYGFSLLTLSPMLLITLGVTLINPPAFAIALASFKDNAASATAFINTARMSISALVAGIVGTVLTYTTLAMPISLLLCGLLCLWLSYSVQAEAMEIKAELL